MNKRFFAIIGVMLGLGALLMGLGLWTLKQFSTAHGTVLHAETGAPVPGAEVMLESETVLSGDRADKAPKSPYRTRTDEQGFFRVKWTGSGAYRITIQQEGFDPLVRTDLTLEAFEANDLGTFRLAPTP